MPAVRPSEAVQHWASSERQQLERRYREVYRDPQDARASFDLLKAELCLEAARERVARDPAVLGSLRGGWLTAVGRQERAKALGSGPGIVGDDKNRWKAENEARRYQKAAEEEQRKRAAIKVPGLTVKAQEAIRALADADIRPGWTPPQLSKDCNPTPEWIVGSAKGARLYEAILADGPLLAELNRFETARRLAYGGQVGLPGDWPSQMSDAERRARWSLGTLIAARAFYDWYPILQDHVATHRKLKLRVEHAEFMLSLHARRSHGPEPRRRQGRRSARERSCVSNLISERSFLEGRRMRRYANSGELDRMGSPHNHSYQVSVVRTCAPSRANRLS